jgi:hypothetical protein
MVRRPVLIYSKERVSQGTVRRHYMKWRERNGIPKRCDEEFCAFYSQQLQWNGKPLKLILDHKNGVNSDNRPKNLRFLCPNCNSQLDTHGGRNKGRVKKHPGYFSICEDRFGQRILHYTGPCEPAEFNFSGHSALLQREKQGK